MKNHIIVNNEQGPSDDSSYGSGIAMPLEAFAKSLPKGSALNVGFDIDDTLLFSSPQTHFQDMQIKRCMNNSTDKKYHDCLTDFNRHYLGEEKKVLCLEQSDQSKKTIYECTDDFSLPKTIARGLLAVHLKRGDSIYIITARQGEYDEHKKNPSPDQKAIAQSLRLAFGLENKDLKANHIIFAQAPINKHLFIKKYKLDYYYGDADTDITESLMTKTTPVRILRSPASLTNTAAHPGVFGEIVILNSEY